MGMVAPSDSQQILDSLQHEVQPAPRTEQTSTTPAKPALEETNWSSTCATNSCAAWPHPRDSKRCKR